jgi:hypothetical protein
MDDDEEESPSRLFEGPVLETSSYTPPSITPFTEERRQEILEREQYGFSDEDDSMAFELEDVQSAPSYKDLQTLWKKWVVNGYQETIPLYEGPTSPTEDEINYYRELWYFAPGMEQVRRASLPNITSVVREGLRRIRQEYRADRFLTDPNEQRPMFFYEL